MTLRSIAQLFNIIRSTLLACMSTSSKPALLERSMCFTDGQDVVGDSAKRVSLGQFLFAAERR